MIYRDAKTIGQAVNHNGHLKLASLLCAAVASLLGASQSADACNTYYVANNGSDSNPGTTLAQPWQTIHKASYKSLQPCDTVYVRGGTYAEYYINFTSSGTASQPITIAAYPGEKPVVDGTGTGVSQWSPFILLSGSYITLNGFTVQNGGQGIALVGPYNTASNNTVANVQQNGILVQGDYSQALNNKVSSASLMQKTLLLKGGWAQGISAGNNPKGGITHNAVLKGNTSFGNWGEGIGTFNSTGTLIDSNISYDNWSIDYYISDATNAIVRNNLGYTTPLSTALFGRPTTAVLTLADEQPSMPRSANNVIINNLFLNGAINAFSWTCVPGSGLTSALIANNTIVNGTLATGPINTSSVIENNIVYRNDGGSLASVPLKTGLTFSHNLWSSAPPSLAAGTGDITGNPLLALTGTVSAGTLKTSYFALLPGSPAVGKGAAIYDVAGNYLVTSQATSLNIGAYIAASPIQYLAQLP